MFPRMGWTNRGSIPGRGKIFFCSSEMSGPALGLTQSPVQWMAEFFPGIRRPGSEANPTTPRVEVKNE